MYRSLALENEELMALYGAEEDDDCISEENDLDLQYSEDGREGRGVRSSLSLEIHGLQREAHVHFSNQEYYRRLEELKSNHLKNMAELEKMYISQGQNRHSVENDRSVDRWGNKEEKQTFSGPIRRLQRINSQEELDFHDTSSGSDQSEVCGEDLSWTTSQERTFERDMMQSPEEMMIRKNFRFQSKTSCPKPPSRAFHQTGARLQSNSKVTVPKPFQMMLREEERKRHRVRTRSEIELENALLRRELEELRECQKKFRASPAPAHIHLPLYEIISRRHRARNCSDNVREVNQEPFQFLERERRKREARIVAELGKLHREEQQTFRARAMPSSVYGSRIRGNTKSPSRQHQLQSVFIMERETTEGQSDQSSDPEQEIQQSDCCTDLNLPLRSSSSKSVKKQIEVSIQMVREKK